MADFRKLMLTLIAVGLLFATAASAAPYSCQATAVPTLARSEGIAEMMGDVLLTCDGEVPAGGILANIRLRLTANITSNPQTDGYNEASLILDEGLTAASLSFRGYDAGYGSQNVFQATKISDNEIEWAGVVLAAANSTGFYKTIRLTNVRGNVQASGDFATIYASITIVSPSSVPVNNNLLVVAETRPGLTFSVTAKTYKNCELPGEAQPALNFKEGFASAFRPGNSGSVHTTPGGGYLDEGGWQPGNLIDGTTHLHQAAQGIGVATQGTRLMARLKDIPSGATVKADGTFTVNGMIASTVTGMDANGKGGTISGADYTVGSDGLVVYEITSITATSYSSQDTVSPKLTVTYTVPGPLGIATANGSFAPISTVFTMSDVATEPRFRDSNTGDSAIITINPCRTILLFPFITNQAGFDTGIAISNTTRDPLSTANQAGVCRLYYFGNTGSSTGPAVQTSPSVPAGGQLVFALSGGGGVYAYNGGSTGCSAGNCVAPAFQGYMFALCDFQYAHGYAFISDLGSQKLAQGYLALVIPDRTGGIRPPDPFSTSIQNTGEQLGN